MQRSGVADNQGFSLIEMLIVISIFLLLGSLGAGFYSRFLLQSAVADTQNQMVNQLRKAQMYAMMSRSNSNWGVRYGSNTITLFQGPSYVSRSVAVDEKFTVNPNIAISGFSEVVFNKMTGTPSATGSFSVSGNGNVRGFAISSQGVIQR